MRTRILIVLIGWLAAVLTVATIASLAINTAGRQVISDPIAAAYTPESAPASTRVTRAPTTRPTTPEPNLTARPNSTRSGQSRPAKTHPNTVSPTVSPTPEVTPDPVFSTYSTWVGRIRVGCSEAKITLAGGYAMPASGWSVQIEDGGPDRVKVRFRQHRQRDLLVVAICEDGRPQFDQARPGGRRQGDRDGRHNQNEGDDQSNDGADGDGQNDDDADGTG